MQLLTTIYRFCDATRGFYVLALRSIAVLARRVIGMLLPGQLIGFGSIDQAVKMRRRGFLVLSLVESPRTVADTLRAPLDPAGGNDLHTIRRCVEWTEAQVRRGRAVYIADKDGRNCAPAIAAAVMFNLGIFNSSRGAMRDLVASAGRGRIKARVFGDVQRMLHQKVTYLNADAHGFGDATFTSWISQGSRNAPVTLVHRATGKMKQYLEMLGQYVADRAAEGCADTFDAYWQWEMEIERGSIPRIYSRGRALGITESFPTRPTVTVPADTRAWARVIGVGLRKTGYTKKMVVLWPNTIWKSREWPEAHWIDLAYRLKTFGVGVTFCLGHRDERFRNVPASQFGMPWENWAAMMLEADLNVCISSGPACLAGTLDVPTIVLEGPTKPTIWAHNPSIEVIRVTPETIDCVGCHFDPTKFRAACDLNCQALMRITPEVVFRRIMAKLKELENDPVHGKYGHRTPCTVYDKVWPVGGTRPQSDPRSLAVGQLPHGGPFESGSG